MMPRLVLVVALALTLVIAVQSDITKDNANMQSQLWNMMVSAVKEKLGMKDDGVQFFMFPTATVISAKNIDNTYFMNGVVSNLANSVANSDSSIWPNAPAKLTQMYSSFLSDIKLPRKNNGVSQMNIDRAQKDLDDVQTKMDAKKAIVDDRYAKYAEEKKAAGAKVLSKDAWARSNVPGYSTLKTDLFTKQEYYNQLMISFYGQEFQALNEAKTALNDARDSEPNKYNMKCTMDADVTSADDADVCPRFSAPQLKEVLNSFINSNTFDQDGNSISMSASRNEQSSSHTSTRTTVGVSFWSFGSSTTVGTERSDSMSINENFAATINYIDQKNVQITPGDWFDLSVVNAMAKYTKNGNPFVQKRLLTSVSLMWKPVLILHLDSQMMKAMYQKINVNTQVSMSYGPFRVSVGVDVKNEVANRAQNNQGGDIKMSLGGDGETAIIMAGTGSPLMSNEKANSGLSLLGRGQYADRYSNSRGLARNTRPLGITFNDFDVIEGQVNVEVTPNRIIVERSPDAQFVGSMNIAQ